MVDIPNQNQLTIHQHSCGWYPANDWQPNSSCFIINQQFLLIRHLVPHVDLVAPHARLLAHTHSLGLLPGPSLHSRGGWVLYMQNSAGSRGLAVGYDTIITRKRSNWRTKWYLGELVQNQPIIGRSALGLPLGGTQVIHLMIFLVRIMLKSLTWWALDTASFHDSWTDHILNHPMITIFSDRKLWLFMVACSSLGWTGWPVDDWKPRAELLHYLVNHPLLEINDWLFQHCWLSTHNWL